MTIAVRDSRHRIALMLAGAILVAGGAACGGADSGPPAAASPDQLVADTRAAGDRGQYDAGLAGIEAYRAGHGQTPEGILALSWLGRSALAAGDLDRAEAFAEQTYERAQAMLESRALDAEPDLPTALGAAIEVLGQAGAARGARTDAVTFLQRELQRYGDSSMAMRIQKTINLISLEGTPAPPLDLSEFIGDAAPPPLSGLEGDVLLLFFWAHWCSDCKAQAPVLEALADRYGESGFRIVAPTRRYGYVAGGEPAPGGVERVYIEQVRADHYPMLADVPMPLSTANHQQYGVSTTPTLVLVDRGGTVRLYHPGLMPDAELDPLVAALVDEPVSALSASD